MTKTAKRKKMRQQLSQGHEIESDDLDKKEELRRYKKCKRVTKSAHHKQAL